MLATKSQRDQVKKSKLLLACDDSEESISKTLICTDHTATKVDTKLAMNANDLTVEGLLTKAKPEPSPDTDRPSNSTGLINHLQL